MDFPELWIPPYVINTSSFYSNGQIARAIGATAVAPGSTAWPSANRALYVPVCLPGRFVVRSIFLANGATVSGNIDLGIYDAGGARIVSTGSTAQSGTTALQIIVLGTPIILTSGNYYMACAIDNITATATAWADTLLQTQHYGMLQQDTAFVLPASATFAACTATFSPQMGISSLASGF